MFQHRTAPACRFLAAVLLASPAWLSAADASRHAITPEAMQTLEHGVSERSLRANLSFLASDALEGRDTPSRGLDIAAEFIAAQFRRAGLEPAGDDGYFQTAHMKVVTPDLEGLSVTIRNGDRTFTAPPGTVAVNATEAVDLQNTPVFKIDSESGESLQQLAAGTGNGKIIVVEISRGSAQTGRKLFQAIRAAKPAAVITVSAVSNEHERPRTQLANVSGGPAAAPRLTITGIDAKKFFDDLIAGEGSATASIHVVLPHEAPVKLRNVVGILRGSDPALKDTCVVVSAHYDHLGIRAEGTGDRIYNGANDDGSGAVSVTEVAAALADLKQPPKRSIVFVTFFGEEKGLFGSRYYAQHPVCPLEKTIADVNLEQLGRTDAMEGAQIGKASFTGSDYSSLPDVFRQAGKDTGVAIVAQPRNSDLYFAASDNLSFATAGVPAHTICVAFNYSDYHGLGDEWTKIDYANMARIDRMIALGTWNLADSVEPPHWNPDNPKAERYLEAWKKLHGETAPSTN